MSENPDLPRVSCVIPVFNGQAYLHEAIDSVLAQDHPDVEIVVVNDGSTDGTADVMSRYGDRIRAFTQPNLGVSVARNRGVEMSCGQLLSFLDADDLLDRKKISLQVAALRANPQMDFCLCHSSFFWSPELAPDTLKRDARYADPFWREVLPTHISTWLFRRELWDRIGGFQPGLRTSQDVDWFSRARDLPIRPTTLADVLTRRRLHPNSVTAHRDAAQVAVLTDLLKAHLSRTRSKVAS